MSLSHFNKKNKNIEMVDISKKNKTKRFAEARSLIEIDKKLYSVIKGDKELKNNYKKSRFSYCMSWFTSTHRFFI